MKFLLLTFVPALLGAALLPASVSAQVQSVADTGPDTVVFTPERGKVVFTHGKHGKQAECKTCHHESKPEKPLESPRQKCGACHTLEPTEPVKTSLRNAMHDTENKEGICYDCHNKEAEAGKVMPDRCADCHKREGGAGNTRAAAGRVASWLRLASNGLK